MIDFDYRKDLSERSPGPDMTPMIDMIFQLLIFFLLTSFFMLPALNVELPLSRSRETTRPSAITLTIRRDGSMLLAGEPVDAADLPALLATALVQSSDRTLVIQADRDLPFGRVVAVMEAARDSGVQGIAFLVEYVEPR